MQALCRLPEALFPWLADLHSNSHLVQVSISFPVILSLLRSLVMHYLIMFHKFPQISIIPWTCDILWYSGSHHNIWRDAHVPQRTYHYYHPESKGLDFAGLIDDVKVLLTFINLELSSFVGLFYSIFILSFFILVLECTERVFLSPSCLCS